MIKKILVPTILIFILIFSALIATIRYTIHDKNEKIARSGNYILIAIYKYKAKYKKYPGNLDDLVPRYIDKPVDQNWTKGWNYIRYNTNDLAPGFELSRFAAGYKTRVIYKDTKDVAGWIIKSEDSEEKMNLPDPRKKDMFSAFF